MREKLLDAAQALVQSRGLNAVSFQDLADSVGLKKPSVFHHFPSKDALAQSLLERCRTTYGARYGEVLAQQDLSAPKKLRRIAQIFDEALREDKLCLLGALGSSSSGFSEELGNDLRETANLSIERYATVFEEGKSAGTLKFKGSTRDAATAFLSMLQGLQVMARASGDLDSFSSAASSYIDSISA